MKYIILVFPIFIPLRNVCKRNQIHVRINIINLMGLESFQGQLFFYHVKLCGVTITLLHEMLQN